MNLKIHFIEALLNLLQPTGAIRDEIVSMSHEVAHDEDLVAGLKSLIEAAPLTSHPRANHSYMERLVGLSLVLSYGDS